MDLPRYIALSLSRNGEYMAIRNRNELLERGADGSGYRCLWQWASDLHAPKVFPFLGRWLCRRAFADHPIGFAAKLFAADQNPEVTFIIGHRGSERLPLLELTLASIASQDGVAVECIVVEQDLKPQLQGRLPAWVTYLHVPPPQSDMPYNRSMAFNRGAQLARGKLLILHDNDMPVPRDYAALNLAKAKEGYEVVNLKRFIFYLDQRASDDVISGRVIPPAPGIEAIVQNLQAGGSIAVTREAYTGIGGMDESFVGWGGEDNEFWERAETRRVYSFGSLPLLHLWHARQPGKGSNDPTSGQKRYWELAGTSPLARIEALRVRNRFSDDTDHGSRGLN